MIGILVIVIAFGALFSVGTHGMNEFLKINFGELSLALATIVLAIFTYQLASYTYQLSAVETEESKKGREFTRLREKTAFYSELLSGFPEDDISFEDIEKITYKIAYSFFQFLRTNKSIQRRYPMYSEPELITMFKETMPVITDLRDMQAYEKIKDKIPHIIQQVQKDFEKLKKEYEDF